MEVLAKAMVVIILQYISVSNQHVYTLNLHKVICQLYFNKAGKKIIRDKERHYIMIKESILQEDITILNAYPSNNTVAKIC